MVDLDKLNPPQKQAAGHLAGPLLVLAGAGSGKTRVITFRIAHLLELGIPPSAICAMTFTNKAAEEMRERVGFLVQDPASTKQLTIGTFHAFGLTLLRAERRALGLPRGFVIYDQSDQTGLIREALRSVKMIGRDGERRWDVKAILTRISLAKNGFVTPADYKARAADEYDEVTAQVYPKYQEMLRAAAAFDFDDLITEPVRLMNEDEGVRERWSTRFRYVMVDEYQDTNRAQLLMVKHLVAPHGNLLVVGDDDQSIYSWRGADPSNILGFTEMFPGAQLVKLEQNYRSSKTILEAANTVIANNKVRHGKTLWSNLGAGDVITHAVAATSEDEAKWVAREIATLHKEGRRWSDVAVMYRSNLQAKIIEDELRQHEVPYVMYGGQQFFERKEVKDLLAYMRVALNPRDDLALRRVINYPARGIGATTLERFVNAAHKNHVALWDVLRAVANAPDELRGLDGDDAPVETEQVDAGDAVRGATRAAISELVANVTRLGVGLEDGSKRVAVIREFIDAIGLYDDLRQASGSMAAAQRRIDNVEGLLGSLAKQAERAGGRDALATYLRQLSLERSDDDDEERGGDKVVLTTLHGAKGLEFPVCFMVGLEEELLPHIRTLQPQATDVGDLDHATDISEERRLCYVGITRAQRKLYLTRACMRVTRGRQVPRTPSRFLLEIPDELLDVIDLGELASQQVPSDEVKNFFANLALPELD